MEHVVLLVDDDKNVLHGLTRALRRQPYQLYTAQSGDEAMWILKAHDVDVLVTDEKMPGMSGCDLLAWVAEHYPEVVRIVLTGHATTEMAIRAINEGAVYHFFTKPCRDLHLAIVIRKALEQREQIRENLRLRELRQGETGISQRLAQDLETLARIIAHDLREPLRAVSDFCRACEEADHQALDPDVKALLESTCNAAAEVHRLVTDLLENSPPRRFDKPCESTGPGRTARGTIVLNPSLTRPVRSFDELRYRSGVQPARFCCGPSYRPSSRTRRNFGLDPDWTLASTNCKVTLTDATRTADIL